MTLKILKKKRRQQKYFPVQPSQSGRTCLDGGRIKRMGDICNKYNVLVFADEIHFDFIMPGHKHICYANLGKEYADNSITLNAASKNFFIGRTLRR